MLVAAFDFRLRRSRFLAALHGYQFNGCGATMPVATTKSPTYSRRSEPKLFIAVVGT
jgi:hypothetical protein